MRIESPAQFQGAVEAARARGASRKREVLVCCGTGCLANGSAKVVEEFASQAASKGLDVKVGLFTKKTGCHGFCERGPLVVIQPEGILYTKVQPAHVGEILDKTVVGGEVLPHVAEGLARFERVLVTADHGSSRLAALAWQSEPRLARTLACEEGVEVADWRYRRASSNDDSTFHKLL